MPTDSEDTIAPWLIQLLRLGRMLSIFCNDVHWKKAPVKLSQDDALRLVCLLEKRACRRLVSGRTRFLSRLFNIPAAAEPGDPVGPELGEDILGIPRIRLRLLAYATYIILMRSARPIEEQMIGAAALDGDMVATLESRATLADLISRNIVVRNTAGNPFAPSTSIALHTKVLRHFRRHCPHLTHDYHMMSFCQLGSGRRRNTVPSTSAKTLDAETIYNTLRQSVVGQDKALERIAVAAHLWLHQLDTTDTNPLAIRPHILLVGPSGSGKSMIAKLLGKLTQHPFGYLSLASTTASGFHGSSVSDVLEQVDALAGPPKGNSSPEAIVCLDELDKICAMYGDNNLTSNALKVQYELLTMMDGAVEHVDRHLNSQTISTGRFMFVGAGAFLHALKPNQRGMIGFAGNPQPAASIDYNLRESLLAGGMDKQLLARFHSVIELAPLGIEEMFRILMNDNGILESYIRLLQGWGIKAEVDINAISVILNWAYKQNAGARPLAAAVNAIFVKPLLRPTPEILIDGPMAEEALAG